MVYYCYQYKKKWKTTKSNHARKIEGLKLNKPKATFVYRPKISEPARTMETTSDDIDLFKIKNQFDSLRDQDDLLKENELGKTSGANAMNKDTNLNEDSESDVEEGLNRTPKQSKVRQVVNENRLSICAILESHVDISALSKVCSKVFRSWDWTSNASLCSKGCRIILGWNLDVVNVMVVSQTSQPWILMGDFNVALNLEDYSSGSSKLNYAITDFKDCVYNIEVMDINSSGLHFTWNQKPKGGSGLLKKLDRIMGNTEFIDAFPGAYALFQPYRISDHSPAVLNIPNLPFNKPKPFKIFNFLAHKSQFRELVSSVWNVNVDGHKMYQVVSKLKALKKPFRKLLHDQGNLHDRVNKLRFELDEVQKALDLNPNDLSLREEEAVYVQAFSEAKLDEERFLKQKAKIEWLEVGDSNSAYFHKSVKSRIHRGRIDVIMNSDNIEVTGSNVADVFVSHYQMFLGSDMVCDNLNMDGLFLKKVLADSFSNMVRPVTDEEIKAAMFSIRDERAPGPDGLLKEINHTFVALIPKVFTPLKINDYRPISCCNVNYKCISKILTNRILDGIKEVVSDNQSAFVPEFSSSWTIDSSPCHMESLKSSSLLRAGPSIQKSTAFFCLIRGFLWCNGEYKRGKAKVAWDDICLPKCEGGLGLLVWISPNLDENTVDCIRWRDINGVFSEFSVSRAWEAFRPRGNEVNWFRIVWFPHSIPRHSFHLWLVMRNSLKTQDKLRQWDVGINTDLNLLRCSLCNTQSDSHAHLFFECPYSSKVWKLVRHLADMELVPPILYDIVAHLQSMANKRTARSIFGKLILAASSYFVWLERNNRLFKNVKRTPEELRDVIMVTVRLKLLSFKFKNSAKVISLLDRWKMPRSFRLYVC
ncbi:reverse transcriptase domain-containing protein [Tanacetum coccineum]|uniref:Reverse transcriptase domain-containing protein n=1 Tax=Tanacetum coccineum TaxID=301880 RepID=A0ABQ4WBS5_9ASTR